LLENQAGSAICDEVPEEIPVLGRGRGRT